MQDSLRIFVRADNTRPITRLICVEYCNVQGIYTLLQLNVHNISFLLFYYSKRDEERQKKKVKKKEKEKKTKHKEKEGRGEKHAITRRNKRGTRVLTDKDKVFLVTCSRSPVYIAQITVLFTMPNWKHLRKMTWKKCFWIHD